MRRVHVGSPRRATKRMKGTWLGVATTALSLTCGSSNAFLTGSGRSFIPPTPTAVAAVTLKNRVAVAQPNLHRPRPYCTTSPRDRQEQQTLHATSSNWFAQASRNCVALSCWLGEPCVLLVELSACLLCADLGWGTFLFVYRLQICSP